MENLNKKHLVQIAFYKGPPSNRDLKHVASHYGIRLWTWSKYSHAELVIDGVCYSSSARDKGVRRKDIDLTTGRWDVITVEADAEFALEWFKKNEGKPYDWRNIVRFIAPPVGHDKDAYVCFECIGNMLCLAGAHRLTANDLYEWAIEHQLIVN